MGTAIASLPKYACYAIAIWQISLAFRSLAGKTTIANIVTTFIAQIGEKEFSVLCPWIIAILALLYGSIVTIVLRRHIERDAINRKELESIIDPQRSSSELLENGNTNPRDDD